MEVVDGRKLEQQQQHFHVLAVDDSVIDRKLLERLLLTGSSCKVTCVESGDKALKYLGLKNDEDIDDNTNNNNNTCSSSSTSSESLSSSPPSPPQSLQQHQQGTKVNMIMTDYCMPGMSGYDLLKRLKGSSWKDVPVVIMSSENVPSRINMCLEGGAEEFLLKPLQLSDLKKLQPYFLKSLETSSSEEQESPNSSTDNNNSESDNDTLSSNNSNNSNNNNNNINNSIISKRKAMSPEPPPERSRPKKSGL